MLNDEKNTGVGESQSGYAKARLKVYDVELEFEGEENFVQRNWDQHIGPIAEIARLAAMHRQSDEVESGLDASQFFLSDTQDIFAPSEETVTHSANGDKSNPVSVSQPITLLDFFSSKLPNPDAKQMDQVLVITYFYQHIEGRESLSLDDYKEAFRSLKKLAVIEPTNYKSSVRNIVDRTKYLYNPDRGIFALTMPGEKYVQNLEQNEE